MHKRTSPTQQLKCDGHTYKHKLRVHRMRCLAVRRSAIIHIPPTLGLSRSLPPSLRGPHPLMKLHELEPLSDDVNTLYWACARMLTSCSELHCHQMRKFNVACMMYLNCTSIIYLKWSRDGRAKKYTNKICGDNHIHYTFLRLLFLIIMHLLMSIPITKREAATSASVC
jgi:hypothetical protein